MEWKDRTPKDKRKNKGKKGKKCKSGQSSGEEARPVILAHYEMVLSKYGCKIRIPITCPVKRILSVEISYLDRPNAIFLYPRLKLDRDHLLYPESLTHQRNGIFAINTYEFRVKKKGRFEFTLFLPSISEITTIFSLPSALTEELDLIPGVRYSAEDLIGYPECPFLTSLPLRFELEIRVREGAKMKEKPKRFKSRENPENEEGREGREGREDSEDDHI